MNHTHYQQLTSQFIDCEIGPEDERELFAHLGTCDECREFLKESIRLQTDLSISKFKVAMTNQAERSSSSAADRPVLHGAPDQVRYARGRMLALLVMIVLGAGLFWSTALPRQHVDNSDLARQISPSEIPSYQP